MNSNMHLPAGYYVFDGRNAERIIPVKSNLIRLHLSIVRCDLLTLSATGDEKTLTGKELFMDANIFRLKTLFKSLLHEKRITRIDDFIQQFGKERFFTYIDDKGKLSGVITLSKENDQ